MPFSSQTHLKTKRLLGKVQETCSSEVLAPWWHIADTVKSTWPCSGMLRSWRSKQLTSRRQLFQQSAHRRSWYRWGYETLTRDQWHPMEQWSNGALNGKTEENSAKFNQLHQPHLRLLRPSLSWMSPCCRRTWPEVKAGESLQLELSNASITIKPWPQCSNMTRHR